jgi:hypothetical protein
MLTEQNFRPLTSLLESGYTCQIELGDLVQNSSVWHDQAMRVTVVKPDGNTEFRIFRGAKSRAEAGKWLDQLTSGAIKGF